MAPSKGYSPRSQKELAALSRQHGNLQVIAQLEKKEMKAPASKWTTRHLIAYRLLTKPETSRLDAFNINHKKECLLCGDPDNCIQELNWGKTIALTSDPPPLNLVQSSEVELLHLPGGFLWAALARAVRPEVLAAEDRSQPQRKKMPAKREKCFVDSADAISDPESQSSCKSSQSWASEGGNEGLNEDEHDDRQNKPEDVTVHLLGCFLQYALALSLDQPSDSASQVWARLIRNKSTAVISNVRVTAEDDGGICKMSRHSTTWKMGHPFLALLEAKRSFQYIDYDNKGYPRPVVSDSTVAQYLGEAVITWKANQKHFGRE